MSKQYEQTENEPPTACGERGGLGHRDRNADFELESHSKVEDRERRKDGASGRRIPVDVVERMRSGRFERIPMTGTPRRVEEARGCAGAATDVDVEERLDGIPP
jgi:hypothetical protein